MDFRMYMRLLLLLWVVYSVFSFVSFRVFDIIIRITHNLKFRETSTTEKKVIFFTPMKVIYLICKIFDVRYRVQITAAARCPWSFFSLSISSILYSTHLDKHDCILPERHYSNSHDTCTKSVLASFPHRWFNVPQLLCFYSVDIIVAGATVTVISKHKLAGYDVCESDACREIGMLIKCSMSYATT